MKTVLEAYNEANSGDKYVPYTKWVGAKVRVIEFNGGKEGWSETVHTIEEFIEDACGEGCCQAFRVSGFDSGLLFWSGQLRLA